MDRKDESPVLILRGEKVGLGPMTRDLIELGFRWINDLGVTHTLGVFAHSVMTREDEEGWYQSSIGRKDMAAFAIYDLSTMRPIGTTDLRAINHQHGTALYGILIGEKDCWGRGYGTEATRLTLDYGFNVLGLHNILLTVYAYNRRGVRAYEKAGFRLIGRRREARRLAGKRYDEIMMDAVATDFVSPVALGLITPD